MPFGDFVSYASAAGAVVLIVDRLVNRVGDHAVLRKTVLLMRDEIDSLHVKASNFQSEQQKRIGEVSQTLVQLQADMKYVSRDLQNLQRIIPKLLNGDD